MKQKDKNISTNNISDIELSKTMIMDSLDVMRDKRKKIQNNLDINNGLLEDCATLPDRIFKEYVASVKSFKGWHPVAKILTFLPLCIYLINGFVCASVATVIGMVVMSGLKLTTLFQNTPCQNY